MIGKLLFSSVVLGFPLLLRAEVVDIGNAELARLLAAGVPVIDIRTAGEWQETGVVPDSRLLTLFDERGRADTAAWLQRVQGIVKADEPVIVICRSGNRTRTASQVLSQQGGFRTVYNVRDGIRPWLAEGRPLAPVSASVGTGCPVAGKC
ncbi:rhodanese-like domain-containing protein [Accumulibacter sp.]|uniref:rhodanese-like domain-containing protein n=1 Tax=Accumulibacter sp. TaxID=2053492 RepID=UPI0025EE5E1D|nr:rhodanese-like domain-containing protein [Accumulibacter sp.]MCM8611754.1 rhodanese-like domain-containing protein [Accumulibacter sp.]MCM8635655.1 rhodanese-like domain-containing protein [Accumulibacter sp.]MCM8639242.1 rhodanese-like domain-containing protein [Accumulibacter sp.]